MKRLAARAAQATAMSVAARQAELLDKQLAHPPVAPNVLTELVRPAVDPGQCEP